MDLVTLTALAACSNRSVASVEGSTCVVVYPIGVTPASPPVMTTKGVVGWIKKNDETVVSLADHTHTDDRAAVFAILGVSQNLGFGDAITFARVMAGIQRANLTSLRFAISLCKEDGETDLEMLADILDALNKGKPKKKKAAEESYW